MPSFKRSVPSVIFIDDPSLKHLVVRAANIVSPDVDVSSLAATYLFDYPSASPVAISQYVVPHRHPLQGPAPDLHISEPPQLLLVDLLYIAVDSCQVLDLGAEAEDDPRATSKSLRYVCFP